MPSVLVLRAGCVVAHREIASLRIPSSSPECSPDTLALLHYSLFGKTHTLIFPRILSCTEYILRILLHYSLFSIAQNLFSGYDTMWGRVMIPFPKRYKQARKPRSYASLKLRPSDSLTHLLTRVKSRATSVAKKHALSRWALPMEIENHRTRY